MGVTVAFDWAVFHARYPEIAVTPALAEMYFVEAGFYCRNDGTGLINDPGLQGYLLSLLTAHIAWINRTITAPDGSVQPVNPLTGVISSATEGSVSVGVQNNYPPGSQAWYEQSKYGSAYWAATRGFRTARYRAYRPPVAVGLWREG